MILQWKNNGALESASAWQGFRLVVKWTRLDSQAPASWRLAVYNATAVPDGTFVKGSWPSLRAAQEFADAVVERIIERKVHSGVPPVARQGGITWKTDVGRYGGAVVEAPFMKALRLQHA